MNRYIKYILLIVILLTSISFNIYGEEPETIEKSTAVVGSWDIWLHADGKTWQSTGKPGSDFSATMTIEAPVPKGVDPQNFKVEYIPPNELKNYNFSEQDLIKQHSVNPSNVTLSNFKYLGNGKFQYTISGTLNAVSGQGYSVKEGWQMKLVEGWRYYLPVKVAWEEPKPLPKVPVPGEEEVPKGKGLRPTGIRDKSIYD